MLLEQKVEGGLVTSGPKGPTRVRFGYWIVGMCFIFQLVVQYLILIFILWRLGSAVGETRKKRKKSVRHERSQSVIHRRIEGVMATAAPSFLTSVLCLHLV